MTAAPFVSRYDQRVSFVQDVIQKNSELSEQVAHELSVRVLDALDRIPEPTR